MVKILLFMALASTQFLVFAAELVDGERSGKIKFHDQEFVPTTFVIRSINSDDVRSYRIEMIHDDRLYDLEQLAFDGAAMKFVLDTGQKYNCLLSLDEDSKNDVEDCKDKQGYCGECVHLVDDETQKLIVINIKPPQRDAEVPGNAGSQ